MKSDSFNLHVIDDFLSHDVFLKIINEISNITWDGMKHAYESKDLKGKHVWYSRNIELEGFIAQNIKENIKNKTVFPIKKFNLLSFTMATKVDPFPHVDVSLEEKYENQLIL